MARYSEAQKKATMKYIKNNYDEIKIRVPKGKKDEYKSLAESRGTSLTQLIVSLLNEEMNKTEVTTMKELRNKYDTEIAIENLDEAKKYVMPDLT